MAGKGRSERVRFSGLMALVLLATCFTCLCLPAAARGGVVQEWERRYNILEPGSWDKPTAMAVDTAGNVYVTGYSDGHGTGLDYATIKYSPEGEELWVRRYNRHGDGDDYANAIAVDGQGNVYVTGSSYSPGSHNASTTIKYSADGQQLWAQQYHPPDSNFSAGAMAVDGQGNVYVTGGAGGTSSDFTTLKYTTDGQLVWVRSYNGPGNGIDSPTAITVDRRGNVYVTGISEGYRTGYDYATIMYDSRGREIWVRRYQGPGVVTLYNNDYARAIAVDGLGNVYVTGGSSEKWSDYHCFTTIKYSQRGKELWVRRHPSPGFGATSIALDRQGNVYVTGYANDLNRWALNTVTLKYDSNGHRLWARRANGYVSQLAPGYYDLAPAIAVDSQGNAYITDTIVVEVNPWDHAHNLRTFKYDTNGKLQWQELYDLYALNYARAIALDGQGRVYVTSEAYCGGGGDQTGYDYLTIKYTQTP